MTPRAIVIPLAATLVSFSLALVPPLMTSLVPLVLKLVTTLVIALIIALVTLEAALKHPGKCCCSSNISAANTLDRTYFSQAIR